MVPNSHSLKSMNITKGKHRRPQRLVVYTPEGFGKSTLGSQFPNPLFIDMEKGGTDHLDVSRVKAETYAEAKEAVAHVTANPSEFGTVVVDTADWLEKRISAHVCKQHKQDSIEGFGYGKGYTYLAEEFSRFLLSLDGLISAGVNVLVLAHSHVKPFTPPDAAQGYDRYELKMSKQTAPILKEWCDALLFGNFHTRVQDRQQGKARGVGGTERVLHTEHAAAWDAKNRLGLAGKVPFTIDSLSEFVITPQKAQDAPEEVAAAPEGNHTPEPVEASTGDPEGVTGPLPHVDVAGLADLVDKSGDLTGEDLNGFLRDRGQIGEREGWGHVGVGYAQRALGNPDGFLGAIRKWKEQA